MNEATETTGTHFVGFERMRTLAVSLQEKENAPGIPVSVHEFLFLGKIHPSTTSVRNVENIAVSIQWSVILRSDFRYHGEEQRENHGCKQSQSDQW